MGSQATNGLFVLCCKIKLTHPKPMAPAAVHEQESSYKCYKDNLFIQLKEPQFNLHWDQISCSLY